MSEVRFHWTVGEMDLARIVVTFKILPEDVDINLDKLKEEVEKGLPEGVSVYKFDEDPIAFGLVALIAYVIMHEENGGKMDQVEESIRSIDDVSEVEVVMVRRI